ncbi:MAG: hypothetical protein M1281_09225 [Chloroflexi bacterium]|nr:hypothetical protein [Chloroflexota bacterium]
MIDLDQLADDVVKQLSRSVPLNDVIYEVCQAAGMEWNDGREFVRQAVAGHRQQINRRRFVILLSLSIAIGLGGTAVLLHGAFQAHEYALVLPPEKALDTPLTLFAYIVQNEYLITEIPLGVAMLVGGSLGIRSAFNLIQE